MLFRPDMLARLRARFDLESKLTTTRAVRIVEQIGAARVQWSSIHAEMLSFERAAARRAFFAANERPKFSIVAAVWRDID